jgi:hypothetical protein
MRRDRLISWCFSSENQKRRKRSRPRYPPDPSCAESARESRARHSLFFYAFLRFFPVPPVLNPLTRIFGAAFLAATLEPTVAHGEEERAVIAGVVIAQAGAGKMPERAFEEKRAPRLHEQVRAHDELWREIHLRSIARRNVALCEDDASRDGHVRRHLLPTGEIPLPDDRLETAAIHSTGRRKNGVERQDVHSPFEIAVQYAVEMVAGKDPAHPPTAVRKLGIVGFSEAQSAAAENPYLPSVSR